MLNINFQCKQIYNPQIFTTSKVRTFGNQNSDNVTFSGAKSIDWAQDIEEKTKKEILAAVEQIDFEKIKPLGIGADGMVFKLEGNEKFSQGLVIKVSHTTDKNSLNGEMQRVGATFEDEMEILKTVEKINKNSYQYVGYLKSSDGRNIMVSTLVPGQCPQYQQRPLNNKNLKSILKALQTLDEKNILHRDLKKENIFIDKNDQAGLLDYGAAIKFNVTDFDKNINEHHFCDFEMPSNIKNFENTLLAPYLNDMQKVEPEKVKDFYKDYLNLKAEYVHKPNAKYLRNYLTQKSSTLNDEQTAKITKIADYQELCAKVLKEPTKNVTKVEFLKNQIGYNSELAYKNEVLLLNPLANVTLKFNSLIAAKKLEKLTQELCEKPCEVDTKKYLQYQNKYAKFQLEKVSGWTKGLTDWLLDCMTTPIEKAEAHKKPVIEQFTDKQLNNFEIPDVIWTIK